MHTVRITMNVDEALLAEVVDTNAWGHHLRTADTHLTRFLLEGRVRTCDVVCRGENSHVGPRSATTREGRRCVRRVKERERGPE